MNRIRFAVMLAAVFYCPTWAQDVFKSSLQPGERIAFEFHPVNVTGKHAGKEHCLLCEFGTAPSAMVFARTLSEPLVRLIVELDAATARHKDRDMGSFVVFLNDDGELPKKLKQVAEKHKLKHIVLSVDPPAGPEGFNVAKDADVTVLLYREFIVGANHAFKKGDLSDAANVKILADLPKIFKKK